MAISRLQARGSVCQEDPDAPGGNKSQSVGIQINGPDNIVTDVIVFEFTHVGIELNSAANLLQGVHTWNAGVYEGAFYKWKYGNFDIIFGPFLTPFSALR